MSARSTDVLAEAMLLPAPARAALAAELIRSLDPHTETDESVTAAWGNEIRRRLEEIKRGAMTTVSWAEAERRISDAARRGKAG